MNDEKTYHWYLDNTEVQTVCYVEDAFSSEQVDKIIEAGEKENIIQGQVYNTLLNNFNEDKSYRNSSISWLNSSDKDNEWLFRRLSDIITAVNKNYFKYDINVIENLQYSIYHDGGFYGAHVDLMKALMVMGNRKISFSIMLTDPEEYNGGELLLINSSSPIKTVNKKGTIILFPSYVLHEVTPVTKGIRKTLVGWVLGPNFK
jgi:PKHD-type hydroxylase